jgi:hypothetical protein
VGATGAGGGASGRGEEKTDSAKAEIEAACLPALEAGGNAIAADGFGRIQRLVGDAAPQIRLMETSGMVVKTDPTLYTIDIVNPSSGEVLQTPQIRTEEGVAALRTLKPGDPVTTVFSIQTAIKITVIR